MTFVCLVAGLYGLDVVVVWWYGDSCIAELPSSSSKKHVKCVMCVGNGSSQLVLMTGHWLPQAQVSCNQLSARLCIRGVTGRRLLLPFVSVPLDSASRAAGLCELQPEGYNYP